MADRRARSGVSGRAAKGRGAPKKKSGAKRFCRYGGGSSSRRLASAP